MEKITNPALQRRRKWLAASCALLLAGTFAGWHLASWPVRYSYPGEQNGSEGIPFAEIVLMRQGVHIYAPASAERFNAANYGPLFYLLGSRLINPAKPGYGPLRILSWLGMLGCAGGIGLLAFWVSRSLLAAILAPLIFLSYAFVESFGTSVRSDMVALAVALGGFLVAYRSQTAFALSLVALLTVVSVFYKQQFVAFPAAVVAYLIIEKRYGRAFQLAGFILLGVIAFAAMFHLAIFRGQAFLDHFLLYNDRPFSFTQLVIGLFFFFLILTVPMLMALQYLRARPDRLLLCCVASTAVFSLLAVTRAGSDTNFFLEPVVILSVPVAALIAQRIKEASACADVLVLLGVSLFTGQWFTPSPPKQQDFVMDRTMQQYLRQTFAPQTPALGYYPGDLVRAGLRVPISNLYHYTQLVRAGRIPDRELSEQLEGRRFGAIVLTIDLRTEQDQYWLNYLLTESARAAILNNYRVVNSLEMPAPQKFRSEDRYYIWMPKE